MLYTLFFHLGHVLVASAWGAILFFGAIIAPLVNKLSRKRKRSCKNGKYLPGRALTGLAMSFTMRHVIEATLLVGFFEAVRSAWRH